MNQDTSVVRFVGQQRRGLRLALRQFARWGAALAVLTVGWLGQPWQPSSASAALIASADIAAQQLDPTTFRYDITLHDPGTTNLGTFWYSWIPGEGILHAQPFNIQSPTGWSDLVTDTFSVQWKSSTSPVTPGQSLTGFQFDSHDTPSQVFGLSQAFPTTPVGTSFVYSGAPFSDSGFQFVVSAVPEPSTGILLAACGLDALVWRSWRRPAAAC